MVHLTGVEQELSQRNLVALADAGYTASDHIWTINDLPRGRLRRVHAGLRSVVEQMFARVRLWEAANRRFKQSPEMQEFALGVIYSLVQLKNFSSPPRPNIAGVFPQDPFDSVEEETD